MAESIVNASAKTDIVCIGNESTPILVIDDFINHHQTLINYACSGEAFVSQDNDFYPGKRKGVPNNYAKQIAHLYLPLLKSTYGFPEANTINVVLSALSLSVTAPSKLKPIQTIPHFDTAADNQFAFVHYLCDQQHGGTSFYRHNKTTFERIHADRLPAYAALLKQQAMAAQLHVNPQYINGSTQLFERIHSVDAAMNRAIIYPSNLLHSGNIQAALGLSSDPRKGRLTVSSFFQLI